jgi:flagellar hook-associated protein 3 FlgL
VLRAGNFFDISAANPPQRVAGPPFNTATALVAGTPSNTVSWYIGEAGSLPARSTATARVDESLTLSYGMRANEQALRVSTQSIAVFAAMTFSVTDPNAAARYEQLKQRVITALDAPSGQQKIADIQSELAGVQTAMASAKDRHQHSQVMLQNFLQDIEGAPQEEVATQILALQTTLQATMQTTALLLQTNLLKYL